MSKPKTVFFESRNNYKVGDFESITVAYAETWELEPGDDPKAKRKALITHVENLHRIAVRRQLKANIARRVNPRDSEAQDYMDEICDYFEVVQAPNAPAKPQK